MKYRIEIKLSWGWALSEAYTGTYTKTEAQHIIRTNYPPLTYRKVPVKKPSRLSIAKVYQRQIAKLQREREKLYAKALRELKMKDNNLAFDWFFNNQSGKGAFVGVIGK